MTYGMYRFLVAWLLIVTIALLGGLGLVGLVYFKQRDQGATLSAQGDAIARGLTAQTGNRVANVSIWCNAINQQGSTLNAYVGAVAKHNPGVVPRLHLALLPCRSLEQQTAASTQSHGPSSRKQQPKHKTRR